MCGENWKRGCDYNEMADSCPEDLLGPLSDWRKRQASRQASRQAVSIPNQGGQAQAHHTLHPTTSSTCRLSLRRSRCTSSHCRTKLQIAPVPPPLAPAVMPCQAETSGVVTKPQRVASARVAPQISQIEDYKCISVYSCCRGQTGLSSDLYSAPYLDTWVVPMGPSRREISPRFPFLSSSSARFCHQVKLQAWLDIAAETHTRSA